MGKERQSFEGKELLIIGAIVLNAFIMGIARGTQNYLLEGLAIIGVPTIVLAIIILPKKDLRFSWGIVGMTSVILVGLVTGLLLLVLSFSENNNTLYWLGGAVISVTWVSIAMREKRKGTRAIKQQGTL